MSSGFYRSRVLPSFPEWTPGGGDGLARWLPRASLQEAATDSRAVLAFRTLRTNILFAQGHAMRTMVVTSAAPGEGKTVTAANLAVTFARDGKQVLLVDCDLPRARLHTMFGLSRGPGLTEVLSERASLDVVIRSTPVQGLSLLPVGARHPGSPDLLKSAQLRELLQELADRFDLVILDTPPVLALTDAAILAALADGVVLVVRAGKTDRDAVQEAFRQLTAVGARVVGTVLNDPTETAPRYEYSYGQQDVPAGSAV
jgi:capsular exopolysaccharide synthesis family protein